MDENQVVDIWMVFKESIDKKAVETVAERYIDMCADFGTSDETFNNSLGACPILDDAITYYLDDDDYVEDDDYDDWDD